MHKQIVCLLLLSILIKAKSQLDDFYYIKSPQMNFFTLALFYHLIYQNHFKLHYSLRYPHFICSEN